ncbi:ACP phosphodiesterase [Maribacter sp. 2308TA10-17]|uniref:acyl carrier protein phosphodiesterase n=1 Tax=Maribacter sp. 2308TA10-17 TaxID=3386276 RepID=UPI0039BD626C
MNFLAHIYLSFEDDEITLGNFIADSIRGNKFKHLPEKVQKGIALHRAIDSFTDAHPTVRKSTKRLHKNYSHYSGVIVDIFYDHYLAKNWSNYSNTPLDVFVDNFYDLLEDNYEILPDGIKRMMPYMIADNWIFNYSKMDGIGRVLNGMNRRTKNKSKMNFAILDLEEHYDKFEKEFTSFFEELTTFSRQKLNSILEPKV